MSRAIFGSLLLLSGAAVYAAETSVAALHAHMDALNTTETAAVAASQHYPFQHLWPDGQWWSIPSAEEMAPLDLSGLLGSEWRRSVIEDTTLIMAGELAHSYRVIFSRRRADDSVMGRFEAIWVATLKDGAWRVQFRHGAIRLE